MSTTRTGPQPALTKTLPALPPLDDVLQARADGVPWTDLIDEFPADHPSPAQLHQIMQARGYVQFRAALDVGQDPQTGQRGARILLAREAAPLREKVWGLPEDPSDEYAADFSDMSRALDDSAEVIHLHRHPATRRRGRHGS